MYKKETLIVITNYAALLPEFSDLQTRLRWGVIATPVLNNGNYILPLGWEDELQKVGIDFEVKEVEIYTEILE